MHQAILIATLLAADTLPEAVHADKLDVAQRMIRAGASVQEANRYGVTPLSLACENGNAAMVRLLLQAGADPETTLPGGETALMTASRTGNLEVVQLLLAHGAKVDGKEARRSQTALMWAAAEGHAKVIEVLVAAGADLHARVSSGFTPLLFAVREGHSQAVFTLLKLGADPNESIELAPGVTKKSLGPRAGTSALLLAVINAHFQLAADLLDRGANPNGDASGWTALHAISDVRKPGVGDNNPAPFGSGLMTSLELVKKLKESGANLDARMTRRIAVGLTGINTLGATPYFIAARAADAELMRALVQLGADPKIPNADGSTPLHAAAGLGTRSPGEDAGTETEVVEALAVALEHGADINAVDKNGETAMHGAAYKNYPAAVLYLASKGAKREIWNQPNKQGWTPMRIAEGYRFGNFKPSPETVAALQKVQ
ncbi:ankyrin repeat domain-containing protein [Bryobacter aggregatus]|uniref:ankyrin repeat domain-containing protein n=1 Tax=Bryobacter aggregatus TaxID=360054 RepID=UPI00069003C3|nr:ankyrin repeat domain-containing protein [Bryobacter aggregatus]